MSKATEVVGPLQNLPVNPFRGFLNQQRLFALVGFQGDSYFVTRPRMERNIASIG
jgi:hypothetical protein